MEITTFGELIDWTRKQHGNLARCLGHYAAQHRSERARGLLQYLANHESEIEYMVADFERQADNKALDTLLYDYQTSPSRRSPNPCEAHYTDLDFDEICQEVFSFHDYLIGIYEVLARKALIIEVRELVGSLLEMEQHEVKRLAQQTTMMKDL